MINHLQIYVLMLNLLQILQEAMTCQIPDHSVIFFEGNNLTMTNSFNKTHPECRQEIRIYAPGLALSSHRLASCINSKYWAKNATVIPGILTNETKIRFRLGHVAFYCSQSHNLWHATLEVSAASTTGHEPPFRKIDFILRCSGSNERQVQPYLVKSKLQLVHNRYIY